MDMAKRMAKRPKVVELHKEDAEIRRCAQEYYDARRKRRVNAHLNSKRLAALPIEEDDMKAVRALSSLIEEMDRLEEVSFADLVVKERELELRMRQRGFVGNPLHASRASLQTAYPTLPTTPFEDCVEDSAPFDFPPFMPFWGVRTHDWGEPLFTQITAPETGVPEPGPPWSTGLHLPGVRVTAHGRDKLALVSASWCFKPPTHIELCGFWLYGEMTIDGILDNKHGSSVRIQMDCGITQYRIDKAWDEIEPSQDLPYRNIRSPFIKAGGIDYGGEYVDDTYGVHSLTPLKVSVWAYFSTSGARCGTFDCEPDDTLFVGYSCTVDVGEQSIVQFEHSDQGRIVMEEPELVLYTPEMG
jgi:hypothetical protein